MAITFLNIIGWLQQHQLPCLFKKVFGIECPGCGFQRSIIALLKGNIAESFTNYPALFVIIAFFIFLIVEKKVSFTFSTLITQVGIAAIFITILANYIYKLTS